jgi:lysophospholipase L1-like esterase
LKQEQIRTYRYLPFFLFLILISFLSLSFNLIAQTTDPDSQRFGKEIETFLQWDKKNSFNKNEILFVGSSSIRFWPSASSFPNLYIINRGFGGAHISDVNHYYERIVKKYKPAKIIFYAGDNDIAAGKTPDQVLKDYKHFIGKVEQDFPQTHVFYIPIKPSLKRWQLWPQMLTANLKVKQFIEAKPNLFYIDTASPMLNENGEPNPDLFLDDGLHLNEQGYQLWDKVLAPFFETN